MRILNGLLVCLLHLGCFSQVAVHFIELDSKSFILTNSSIDVNKVIDNRAFKENVGVVKVGRSKDRIPANLQNGFEIALSEYYKSTIKTDYVNQKYTASFRRFEISEKYYGLEQTAIVDIIVDYMNGDSIIYSDTLHHEQLSSNATKIHGFVIAEALYKSLENFYYRDVTGEPHRHNVASNRPFDQSKSEKEIREDRNVTAIGYQIGGLTLVGINYEYRLNDILGIHGGVGFIGFTLGTKFHFNPEKDGSFLNLSYKSGGIGLIKTAALEYGGRKGFGDSNFGFHFQVGLAKVIEIDDAFANDLFKGAAIPPAILSLGVGFSW